MSTTSEILSVQDELTQAKKELELMTEFCTDLQMWIKHELSNNGLYTGRSYQQIRKMAWNFAKENNRPALWGQEEFTKRVV